MSLNCLGGNHMKIFLARPPPQDFKKGSRYCVLLKGNHMKITSPSQPSPLICTVATDFKLHKTASPYPWALLFLFIFFTYSFIFFLFNLISARQQKHEQQPSRGEGYLPSRVGYLPGRGSFTKPGGEFGKPGG